MAASRARTDETPPVVMQDPGEFKHPGNLAVRSPTLLAQDGDQALGKGSGLGGGCPEGAGDLFGVASLHPAMAIPAMPVATTTSVMTVVTWMSSVHWVASSPASICPPHSGQHPGREHKNLVVGLPGRYRPVRLGPVVGTGFASGLWGVELGHSGRGAGCLLWSWRTLQAVLERVQDLGHTPRLGGPAKRRFGVSPAVGINQRFHSLNQAGVEHHRLLAAPSRPAENAGVSPSPAGCPAQLLPYERLAVRSMLPGTRCLSLLYPATSPLRREPNAAGAHSNEAKVRRTCESAPARRLP